MSPTETKIESDPSVYWIEAGSLGTKAGMFARVDDAVEFAQECFPEGRKCTIYRLVATCEGRVYQDEEHDPVEPYRRRFGGDLRDRIEGMAGYLLRLRQLDSAIKTTMATLNRVNVDEEDPADLADCLAKLLRQAIECEESLGREWQRATAAFRHEVNYIPVAPGPPEAG
ncbi:MAG: hypothetical protein OXH70_17640 [Acidobacteria bacterium]|nr:hypothetical protein [Acidobacteriota bacterium]